MGRCKGLRVDVHKPKDIGVFLSCVETIRREISTADQLLFEEIEKMVKDKETFVTGQSERLKEMDDAYNTLKDYLEVLLRAQKL